MDDQVADFGPPLLRHTSNRIFTTGATLETKKIPSSSRISGLFKSAAIYGNIMLVAHDTACFTVLLWPRVCIAWHTQSISLVLLSIKPVEIASSH